MQRDPVIEEIRRNGAALAEECGGDVHRMAEMLRRKQNDHASRVIRRPQRTPGPAKPNPEI
jgi:hypothetical protein